MHTQIIPQKNILILLCILALGIYFRFWNMGASDVITDEGTLGFRALGMIDFDAALNQPSPWEKYDPPPLWMKLSFHDHPVLFFWIQNFSLKIFGENTFALRLSSAVLGSATVFLIFLITKKIAGEKAAIFAGLLSAVNISLVWISRLGLQESAVIFFMLLSIFFFLEGEKKSKNYFFFGISLGLAILTKYTSLVVLPIIFSYGYFLERKIFREKNFWMGLFLVLLVSSPILIYNIMLYKTFGHFDFQFSYLFGNIPDYWKIQPGKAEFQGVREKFIGFFQNLYQGGSPGFFSLAVISFFALLNLRLINNPARKKTLFAVFALFFIMYLAIGPSQRFLSLFVPVLVIMISSVFALSQKYLQKNSVFIIFAVFFLTELLFSYNTNINRTPIKFFSRDIQKHYCYCGYNELDRWIHSQLIDKKPRFSFPFQYRFLETLRQKALETRGEERSILFVYDENFNEPAALWIMHRYSIYHGWPVLHTRQYLETLQKEGRDVYQNLGFEKIYLIKKMPGVLGKSFSKAADSADEVLNTLGLKTKKPSFEIQDFLKKTAFLIYEL